MLKLEVKREINAYDFFSYKGTRYTIIKEDISNPDNFQCLYKDASNAILFESIPKKEIPVTHSIYHYSFSNGYMFKRGEVIYVRRTVDGVTTKFNAIIVEAGSQSITFMHRNKLGQDRVDMITASNLYFNDIEVQMYEMPSDDDSV